MDRDDRPQYATLKMAFTFENYVGIPETYEMVVPVEDYIAQDIKELLPPDDFSYVGTKHDRFTFMVETIRKREFRKDLFIQQATRLGALLAERMEDAEGWHDSSRIDPARRQLSGDKRQQD